MEFVVNDCSLHEQFDTAAAFIDSLRRLLTLRERIARSSRVVRCPRKLLHTKVGPGLTLQQCLHNTRSPLTSWSGLVQWAREECPGLILTSDVIRWLDGHPFFPGAAERFQVLLKTLDTIKGSFDKSGTFTKEGMRLFQDHFNGEKAWFTDSSDPEKNHFCNELTFPDPEKQGSKLLCSWHGKVKIEQMRMHFTYPIRHDRPLYIVYIGPKLTKR